MLRPLRAFWVNIDLYCCHVNVRSPVKRLCPAGDAPGLILIDGLSPLEVVRSAGRPYFFFGAGFLAASALVAMIASIASAASPANVNGRFAWPTRL